MEFAHYARLTKRFKGIISRDLFHIVDWYSTIVALAGYPKQLTHTDGYDQRLSLSAGWPGPRTEPVYNINTVLIFTAAIRCS